MIRKNACLARCLIYKKGKVFKKKMVKLNKQLEERVEERTNDLSVMNNDLRREINERAKAETRIMQLQEDLIRLDRLSTMGELTASISHELHQPLMAIINYSNATLIDIENEPNQNDNISENIKAISEQALRSGGIVKRLREFSKWGEKEKNVLNIIDVVNEVRPLLNMDAKQYHVKLNYYFNDDGLYAEVDDVQIQQVITNLLRNGIEAMEGNESKNKVIDIRIYCKDNFINIEVKDKGIGLDESNLNRIFKSFYTTKVDGVGIGLSISNTIAKSHGGYIKIYNNDSGIGATSRLVLPLVCVSSKLSA